MIGVMPKRHGRWPLGPAYRFAVSVLKPPMTLFTKRDWQGQHWLQQEYPPTDGIVVVANHISWFDPLALAHLLWDSGRPPRFLAKEVVFRTPFVGMIVSNARQIPVHRETEIAGESVAAAVEAVQDGETVVVYPEGTITRDPGLWPMTGKTGAARIALMADVPVIPVAQWGPQEVMGPYVKEFKMIPPKRMQLSVGPPVPLDDLRGRPLDARLLEQATERIMGEMTCLLEEIRGEKAPEQRLDFRAWRDSQHRQEEK